MRIILAILTILANVLRSAISGVIVKINCVIVKKGLLENIAN